MPAVPPGFRVPTQPPRFGERPTSNVIWNADFIIDTSVISRAAESRHFYKRLAVQLAKMTARRDFGRAHIPCLALQEMAATVSPHREALFSVVLNLYRELHDDRISVTGDLGAIIAREWAEPGGSASYSWRSWSRRSSPASEVTGRAPGSSPRGSASTGGARTIGSGSTSRLPS
jgi:hypothetical protein